MFTHVVLFSLIKDGQGTTVKASERHFLFDIAVEKSVSVASSVNVEM